MSSRDRERREPRDWYREVFGPEEESPQVWRRRPVVAPSKDEADMDALGIRFPRLSRT